MTIAITQTIDEGRYCRTNKNWWTGRLREDIETAPWQSKEPAGCVREGDVRMINGALHYAIEINPISRALYRKPKVARVMWHPVGDR